jgi:hypothetical protein
LEIEKGTAKEEISIPLFGVKLILKIRLPPFRILK